MPGPLVSTSFWLILTILLLSKEIPSSELLCCLGAGKDKITMKRSRLTYIGQGYNKGPSSSDINE